MPPKSANRSGKSTPTKGQSRGGEKIQKRDEEDAKQIEEEEARKKAEQEEKERLEKEKKEKEELARLEALEESRREQELQETEERLEKINRQIELLANDRRAHAAWERYMRCDGSPDPTILTQISTYMNLMREDGKDDINIILEESKDIHTLIFELKFLLEDTPPEDITPEAEEQYKQTILNLHKLLMHRYNCGTLKILKEATYEADTESGNLQKVVKGEYEKIMLWANLNKNPRFKSFTFDTEYFTFELPKPLAMADIAIRNLWSKCDLYSSQCSTFYPKPKKVKVPEEEPVPEENAAEKKEGEEEAKEDEGQEAPDTADEVKSTATDGRKSGLGDAAESVKEEDKERETGTPKPDEESTPGPETMADEGEEEELDDILDEDVVDLRQYQQLGGVFHVDLVKLPPQPKTLGGWTLRQVIDEPMTEVEYPSEAFVPKASSRAASARDEARDSESPTKQPAEQPPLTLTLKLPSDVMFFEEPQVAKWDYDDRHWKTTGITDIEYAEETRNLSFKTSHFGTFCLTQDSHVNMPFQQWEMKPMGENHVLLTISAAIAEANIEVKETMCRVQAPEDEESRASELAHLYEKWMSMRELIAALKEAGVNIFPAEDSEKFVSIQAKDIDLDDVYNQMGLLSSSFAFSWSKWNSSVKKEQIVMQCAPWLGHGDTRKKEIDPSVGYVAPLPPAPKLTEDDWTVYLLDSRRAFRLGITEYDDNFINKAGQGCEYHSDLVHAVMETPFLDRPYLPPKEKVTERFSSADMLYVHTVQSLLKATKCITYS